MDNHRDILLHLSLIKGIGPATVNKLLLKIKTENLINLYQFTQTDFIACGVTPAQAHSIATQLREKKSLEEELELLATYNIKFLTIFDDAYPSLLKQIHYPPPVLYVKGFLPVNQKSLAVVGSRKAHNYAQRVIEQLIPALVSND